MPNEEGLETIVKLRREFPALGIIAMSGNTLHSPTWLKVAALLGANQTLAKPFSLSRFTEAVAQVLATNPRNRKTVLQPVSGLSPIDS